MAKYATKSTEARHYIQYDQGEDRWLCTLLLQVGSKVSCNVLNKLRKLSMLNNMILFKEVIYFSPIRLNIQQQVTRILTHRNA